MRGPGVEQIQEEVRRLFPTARTLLLSSDHISSAQAMEQALSRIVHREVDVIVGTQIVAKGHHFPFLTCIGITQEQRIKE